MSSELSCHKWAFSEICCEQLSSSLKHVVCVFLYVMPLFKPPLSISPFPWYAGPGPFLYSTDLSFIWPCLIRLNVKINTPISNIVILDILRIRFTLLLCPLHSPMLNKTQDIHSCLPAHHLAHECNLFLLHLPILSYWIFPSTMPHPLALTPSSRPNSGQTTAPHPWDNSYPVPVGKQNTDSA